MLSLSTYADLIPLNSSQDHTALINWYNDCNQLLVQFPWMMLNDDLESTVRRIFADGLEPSSGVIWCLATKNRILNAIGAKPRLKWLMLYFHEDKSSLYGCNSGHQHGWNIAFTQVHELLGKMMTTVQKAQSKTVNDAEIFLAMESQPSEDGTTKLYFSLCTLDKVLVQCQAREWFSDTVIGFLRSQINAWRENFSRQETNQENTCSICNWHRFLACIWKITLQFLLNSYKSKDAEMKLETIWNALVGQCEEQKQKRAGCLHTMMEKNAYVLAVTRSDEILSDVQFFTSCLQEVTKRKGRINLLQLAPFHPPSKLLLRPLSKPNSMILDEFASVLKKWQKPQKPKEKQQETKDVKVKEVNIVIAKQEEEGTKKLKLKQSKENEAKSFNGNGESLQTEEIKETNRVIVVKRKRDRPVNASNKLQTQKSSDAKENYVQTKRSGKCPYVFARSRINYIDWHLRGIAPQLLGITRHDLRKKLNTEHNIDVKFNTLTIVFGSLDMRFHPKTKKLEDGKPPVRKRAKMTKVE